MQYSEKLRDPRWQRRRLEIFERDGWRCRQCSNSEVPLVCHHRYYLPGQAPWAYPDGCLVTLCEACHQNEHGKTDGALLLNVILSSKGLFRDDFIGLAVAFGMSGPLDFRGDEFERFLVRFGEFLRTFKSENAE